MNRERIALTPRRIQQLPSKMPCSRWASLPDERSVCLLLLIYVFDGIIIAVSDGVCKGEFFGSSLLNWTIKILQDRLWQCFDHSDSPGFDRSLKKTFRPFKTSADPHESRNTPWLHQRMLLFRLYISFDPHCFYIFQKYFNLWV